LGSHHFVLIGGGFRCGIDFAEGESVHLAGQGLRHVRGGIGGAEVHGMAAFCQQHGDGGGNGGFAHAALAHGHDHAVALFFEVGDEVFEAFHFRRRPGLSRRCGGGGDFAIQQQAQSMDAKDVHRTQGNDETWQTANEFV